MARKICSSNAQVDIVSFEYKTFRKKLIEYFCYGDNHNKISFWDLTFILHCVFANV